MISSIQNDCLLIATAIKNNAIENNTLEAATRLKTVHQPYINKLCDALNIRITRIATERGLNYRLSKPLAVISGAGIAGLAASFELRARGYNVVVAEERKNFSRFNVINLNIETQVFLRKFQLLEKFESFVASRIQEHKYLLVKKNKTNNFLALSDVNQLRLDECVSFESKNFNNLFETDGIYSVPIKTLQTFLSENALAVGVQLLGDVTLRILSRTREGGVSKVRITFDQTLKPDLFFIAEGAHSTTAQELGLKKKKVTNICTDENWIFGNLHYSGTQTFVISLIDTSNKALKIANVIFNAKSQVINIAVNSNKELSKDEIQDQILEVARYVFSQKTFPVEEMPCELLSKVSKPVCVNNFFSFPFSRGNVFCIGDAAGSSSPLAGLGGTLGLTLVPFTVKKLIDDYERQSKDRHENFNQLSHAYARRWIQKSESIKKFCLNLFDNEDLRDDK